MDNKTQDVRRNPDGGASVSGKVLRLSEEMAARMEADLGAGDTLCLLDDEIASIRAIAGRRTVVVDHAALSELIATMRASEWRGGHRWADDLERAMGGKP